MSAAEINDYLMNGDYPWLTIIRFVTGTGILCKFSLQDQSDDLMNKNEWIAKPIQNKNAQVLFYGKDVEKIEALQSVN